MPGHGLDLHRPPDAQRAPRPHEGMGRVLRAPVQLREVRYFDIEGQAHRPEEQGDDQPLRQRSASRSTSSDDKSQIAEYLDLYHGEGIQHIALGHQRRLPHGGRRKKSGVAFQDTIETYDLVDKRLPTTASSSPNWKRLRILIDGATHQGAPNELLLQIFTQTVIGPIFFELSSSARATKASAKATSARCSRHRARPDPRRVLQDKSAAYAALPRAATRPPRTPPAERPVRDARAAGHVAVVAPAAWPSTAGRRCCRSGCRSR